MFAKKKGNEMSSRVVVVFFSSLFDINWVVVSNNFHVHPYLGR